MGSPTLLYSTLLYITSPLCPHDQQIGPLSVVIDPISQFFPASRFIACRLLPLPFRKRQIISVSFPVARDGPFSRYISGGCHSKATQRASIYMQCRISLISFSAVSSAISLHWQLQQHLIRRPCAWMPSLPACSATMSLQSKDSVCLLKGFVLNLAVSSSFLLSPGTPPPPAIPPPLPMR